MNAIEKARKLPVLIGSPTLRLVEGDDNSVVYLVGDGFICSDYAALAAWITARYPGSKCEIIDPRNNHFKRIIITRYVGADIAAPAVVERTSKSSLEKAVAEINSHKLVPC